MRIGDKWLRGTIENVSVNGARVLLHGADLDALSKDMESQLRFTTFANNAEGALPVAIRNFERMADGIAIGCRYLPGEATDRRLVADLIFANSSQWEQFQLSRRGNPGLLRGTFWFLKLALFQTYRGLVYLMRDMRGRSGKPAAQVAGQRS
jgi:cellulose synthase (UDP-forming)